MPLSEAIDRDDFILFSESNSRFLAEIAPDNKAEFESIMGEAACACIGKVTSADALEIYGLKGDRVLSTTVDKLQKAWQKPLDW